MHSRADDDALLLLHLLRTVREGCDCQQITGIASEVLSQHFSLELVSRSWVGLDLGQISLKIRICIWIAMSKVDRVIIMLKLDAKRQGIVVECSLSLHGVLVVADVSATSDPTLSISLAVDL